MSQWTDKKTEAQKPSNLPKSDGAEEGWRWHEGLQCFSLHRLPQAPPSPTLAL